MASKKQILEHLGEIVEFGNHYYRLVGYDMDHDDFPCILRKEISPKLQNRIIASCRAIKILNEVKRQAK